MGTIVSPASTLNSNRCPVDWQAWWGKESERIGTNRGSLIELHFEICDRLRASSSSWRRS
jgi:hypothetical protein